MKTSMTIDPKFLQIAGPVLSEFGFGSVKELVKEQLYLMLQSKIAHYEAECRIYENKYGTSFEDASLKNRGQGVEVFNREDDLNDWRFAQEAAELYRGKLRDIQNA